MHVENKPILPSEIADVIWRVYLNFHEINTNSWKFYPENLLFQVKWFYTKIFSYENLEPYGNYVLKLLKGFLPSMNNLINNTLQLTETKYCTHNSRYLPVCDMVYFVPTRSVFAGLVTYAVIFKKRNFFGLLGDFTVHEIFILKFGFIMIQSVERIQVKLENIRSLNYHLQL